MNLLQAIRDGINNHNELLASGFHSQLDFAIFRSTHSFILGEIIDAIEKGQLNGANDEFVLRFMERMSKYNTH